MSGASRSARAAMHPCRSSLGGVRESDGVCLAEQSSAIVLAVETDQVGPSGLALVRRSRTVFQGQWTWRPSPAEARIPRALPHLQPSGWAPSTGARRTPSPFRWSPPRESDSNDDATSATRGPPPRARSAKRVPSATWRPSHLADVASPRGRSLSECRGACHATRLNPGIL
jgi:hypothetical protein